VGNSSQSYGASLAIWDHTVLPPAWHKWACPAITPANQAGIRFTYPGRKEGWVDLGNFIAARLGIKPMTAWSQVQCPNHYDTKSPKLKICWVRLWLKLSVRLYALKPDGSVKTRLLAAISAVQRLNTVFITTLTCVMSATKPTVLGLFLENQTKRNTCCVLFDKG